MENPKIQTLSDTVSNEPAVDHYDGLPEEERRKIINTLYESSKFMDAETMEPLLNSAKTIRDAIQRKLQWISEHPQFGEFTGGNQADLQMMEEMVRQLEDYVQNLRQFKHNVTAAVFQNIKVLCADRDMTLEDFRKKTYLSEADFLRMEKGLYPLFLEDLLCFARILQTNLTTLTKV